MTSRERKAVINQEYAASLYRVGQIVAPRQKEQFQRLAAEAYRRARSYLGAAEVS